MHEILGLLELFILWNKYCMCSFYLLIIIIFLKKGFFSTKKRDL